MKNSQANQLNNALKDKGVQLKHLSVDEYMKTLRLMKKLASYFEEESDTITSLVTEYNKDYFEKTKDEGYQKLSEKEKLDIQPPVKVLQGGFLSGPADFIDKINKIREQELDVESNYISDQKTFKAVTENASPDNQLILFDNLFKQ